MLLEKKRKIYKQTYIQKLVRQPSLCTVVQNHKNVHAGRTCRVILKIIWKNYNCSVIFKKNLPRHLKPLLLSFTDVWGNKNKIVHITFIQCTVSKILEIYSLLLLFFNFLVKSLAGVVCTVLAFLLYNLPYRVYYKPKFESPSNILSFLFFLS